MRILSPIFHRTTQWFKAAPGVYIVICGIADPNGFHRSCWHVVQEPEVVRSTWMQITNQPGNDSATDGTCTVYSCAATGTAAALLAHNTVKNFSPRL